MASGGHHGGSFHTGDHHSDGFSGSGFSGDFGGTGSDIYYRRDYIQDYGGGGGIFTPDLLVIGVATIVFLLAVMDVLAGTGVFGSIIDFLSINFFKLVIIGIGCIFLVAGNFFGKSVKEVTLNPITRKIRLPEKKLKVGKLYHSPYAVRGSCFTWAAEADVAFEITFWEKKYGESNEKAVFDTVLRTPHIVWINPLVWIIGFIFGLVINPFFYRLVIPIFEHMQMSNSAFTFADEMVFYFPTIISLAFGILYFVTVIAKRRLLYHCVARQAMYIESQNKQAQTQADIDEELSSRKYLSTCPNCGAANTESLYYCSVCGSSLEIISSDSVNGA